MELSALTRYPIKATRGEMLMSAALTPEGLTGDRRFIVADASGRGLTQRDMPLLATLEARTSGDMLELRAGGRALNVSVRTSGPLVSTTLFGESVRLVDQGSEAGTWLASLLGSGGWSAMLPSLLGQPPFRLLRAPGEMPNGNLRRGAGLSDQSPLHLLCQESIDGLNARRAAEGKPPVPIDRFRPNLVVRGCEGPHVEDTWRTVQIGGATLQVTHPCPRCTVPDVVQQTGRVDTPDLGPMKSLRDYRARARAGVLFGVYMRVVTTGASVRVGDPVSVEA